LNNEIIESQSIRAFCGVPVTHPINQPVNCLGIQPLA
jgi:hypothetical protein